MFRKTVIMAMYRPRMSVLHVPCSLQIPSYLTCPLSGELACYLQKKMNA